MPFAFAEVGHNEVDVQGAAVVTEVVNRIAANRPGPLDVGGLSALGGSIRVSVGGVRQMGGGGGQGGVEVGEPHRFGQVVVHAGVVAGPSVFDQGAGGWRRRLSQLVALSSTTSTDRPPRAAGAASGRWAPWTSSGVGASRITEKAKVLPVAPVLWTVRRPPMAWTSRWLMARPRPVPP